MKILITGSNGFIGKYIYAYLKNEHNVYTLGRNNCNYNLNLATSCDFNLNEHFDLVIHLAGKAHTKEPNSNILNSFYNINVIGTQNLLNNLLISGIPKRFVYISSVSVYGLINGININENTPLNAVDAYGKSKIIAEEIVQSWCYKNNIICTILRLPIVIGSNNPPGNLGLMIKGIKKGYYFNVDGGTAKKSMVLAVDISKFILEAAKLGGTFNLTDGVHPSFFDLSKCISSKLKKSWIPNMPLFIAKFLAKLGDIFGDSFPINSNKLSKITTSLTFDDTKARISFGWQPNPVIEKFKLDEDA